MNGLSLSTLITDRVLRPANLPTLGFNPVREGGLRLDQTAPTELDQRWRQRRAWGEVHDENACGLGGVAGHAGLFGTALDVVAFGEAWLMGAEVFGLPPALVVEATREQAVTGLERRGLGWMLKSMEGSSAGDYFSPQSFGHTGFTGTSLWIDPQARLVVALLTNSVYPGRLRPGTTELRRAVHDAIWQGAAATG
jgi:CubicO group peptidase (beta-lactamase class C family)